MTSSVFRTFPPALLHLPQLRILDLDGNRLTEIPDTIAQMTALQQLGLGNSPLRALPPSIGGLHSLRALSITKTSIGNRSSTVGFPSQLAQLTQLRRILHYFSNLAPPPPALVDLMVNHSLGYVVGRDSTPLADIVQLTKLPCIGDTGALVTTDTEVSPELTGELSTRLLWVCGRACPRAQGLGSVPPAMVEMDPLPAEPFAPNLTVHSTGNVSVRCPGLDVLACRWALHAPPGRKVAVWISHNRLVRNMWRVPVSFVLLVNQTNVTHGALVTDWSTFTSDDLGQRFYSHGTAIFSMQINAVSGWCVTICCFWLFGCVCTSLGVCVSRLLLLLLFL